MIVLNILKKARFRDILFVAYFFKNDTLLVAYCDHVVFHYQICFTCRVYFRWTLIFLFVMICHLLVQYEIVGNCILIYHRSCSLNSNWRHAAALHLACMGSRPWIYVFTVDITAFCYKCWNVILQKFGHTSNTRRTPICRPDGWAIGIMPVLCGEKWPWDVRSALYRGVYRRISRLVLFWHRMNFYI